MATVETQILDNIIASRRSMLIGGGAALAALATPGLAKAASTVTAYTDADILNFALNLEYLEANFYYLAAFGVTIDATNDFSKAAGAPTVLLAGAGTQGGPVLVKSSPKVPFVSVAVGSYAIETAIEEAKHVIFLRDALGANTAVAQPQIDLSSVAWNGLASTALIGPAFDPFQSDANFLIGAYVFEDVGVTAYHGAAPLIKDKGILGNAAGILAVEAYHAGLIRTTINALDPDGSKGLLGLTQKISALRTKLAGLAAAPPVTTIDDYGVQPQLVSLAGGANVTATTIVDADPTNVVAFARTTTQVLNIVTGGGATTAGTKATGVFFPNGLNGLFS